MNDTVLAFAVLALVAALFYGAWQAIKLVPNPFVAFVDGWRVSLHCLGNNKLLLLALLTVFASGLGMQIFFVTHPVLPETTLLALSVVWQAIMATLVAVGAGWLHLSVMTKLTQDLVDRADAPKPPTFRALAPKVAAVGALVWLLGYVLHIGENATMLNTPVEHRRIVVLAALVVVQLLLSPLALIRPAMAFGRAQPVHEGMRLAWKHFRSLLLITFIFALTGALFDLTAQSAVRTIRLPYWVSPMVLLYGNLAARLLFTLFQTLALEAMTLLFLRTALYGPPALFVSKSL